MDKFQVAHEWYMKHSESPSFMHTEIEQAWQYADAMQDEADKRKENGFPEVLKMADSPQLEWQPDWSQAPSWAGYFAVNGDSKAVWLKSIGNPPYIVEDFKRWFCCGSDYNFCLAPSFNYQGNWRNSLRKRPQ